MAGTNFLAKAGVYAIILMVADGQPANHPLADNALPTRD